MRFLFLENSFSVFWFEETESFTKENIESLKYNYIIAKNDVCISNLYNSLKIWKMALRTRATSALART